MLCQTGERPGKISRDLSGEKMPRKLKRVEKLGAETHLEKRRASSIEEKPGGSNEEPPGRQVKRELPGQKDNKMSGGRSVMDPPGEVVTNEEVTLCYI